MSFNDFKGYCHRCGSITNEFTMSRFNTQLICPTCQEKEKAHPLYKKACEVELEHLKAGDRDFKGIGLPEDLQ